ncbi:sigma-54-dependent transcriptional regulator [Roseimaritima sediminicola]|uniref:sigma-54-dependent transcriptional regulator n=1 Tax=Roseimaritima sediminicola TaxID=2662066 RepID=UPI0012982DC4|nr:sigma-54 dependent transcriptional regulator [Roseimaritima sediminicola]
MSKPPILVVDDEPSICWALQKMLTRDGHDVLTASSAEEGLRLAAEHRPPLVILDVRLPGRDGIDALPDFLEATGNAPVILITAFGDLDTAVAAVKRGATDYLTKPFKLDDAARACRQALRDAGSGTVPEATRPMSLRRAVLVGSSPAMQQAFRQIALVAESDLSVLITGETGTGKELVAAAIVRHSRRSEQPYIPIAPVALNPDLIESELFGHVKGAFTGAAEDRPGLFERAEKGTILLDEIGDLPLGTQVKLLRVLEQGQFCRVGDVTPRRADVRIIAATNCELPRQVASGQFREDLFHRLTGMHIHLPPLRERTEDILPLCQHFLSAMDYAALDSAIDRPLLDALEQRPWYGNIRELKNAIEHAAVVARGRPLSIADFPPPKPGRDQDAADAPEAALAGVVRQWTARAIQRCEGDPDSLHADFLAASEPALLEVVLKHAGGNRAKAAQWLGIHRGTLRDRLRAYRMDE